MDHEDSYFQHLPPEIIEKIFLYPVVKEKELCYLACTCSAFQDILLVNEFWKTKFCQRWPELYSCLQICAKEDHLCWRSLYRHRILLKKDVADKLKELSYKTHSGQDKALLIKEEGHFYNYSTMPILSDHGVEYLDDVQKTTLIVSELLEIYHSGDKYTNLNARYFSEKSLCYLRHVLLERDVKAYTSRPMGERDIEEGAVLIAKWFQPTLTFTMEEIKEKLNRLASQVKATLYGMHPDHPIFKTNCEIASQADIKESKWNVRDCRLVLSAMEQTLEPLLRNNRSTNMQKYYVAENSFINCVLQSYMGIPITLGLVVMAVARRLGLVLEPVSFPRHFILRWMEHPMCLGIDRFTFVNVFNGHYSLTYRDLVQNLSMPDSPITIANCDSCTTNDFLQRMLRNLVALGRHSDHDSDIVLLHHACQLYTLFFPEDLQMILLEIDIQLHLGINLPKAIDVIKELKHTVPLLHARLSQLEIRCERAIELTKQNKSKSESKRRSSYKEVKYSVGMVMRHRRYDYLCVIYGWDKVCKAGRDWIIQMGVNRQQERRPFYNVLVMDGTYRYACQENLLFTLDTCEITHPMVGLYFDSFNGRYYTPCESIQEEYPDDAEATQNSITEFFNSQHSGPEGENQPKVNNGSV